MAIAPTPPVVQTPPAHDQATAVVSGQFTATGQSASFMPYGPFNLIFGGSGGPNGNWSATIRLERSFDGGTSWYVCGIGGDGTQAIWSTNNQDVSVIGAESEKGMIYRLNCTAYTSGTINYRMSQTGQANLSLAVAAAV